MPRLHKLSFLAALLAAPLLAADKPDPWTPALMMNVKRVGSVVVSPDGKQTAFTVREAVMEDETSEYRTHIHLGTVGGPTKQLTQGTKSCDDPQWSPDGKWLAFVSNRQGKKNLWLIRPDGGEAVQLTESKSDITSYKWSPDARSIAFTALDPKTKDEEKRDEEKNDARVIDENIKLSRLWIIPVELPPASPANARQVTRGEISVVSEARAGRSAFDWSPDGKTIVFAHTRTPRPDDWPTGDVSLVEVASGAIRPLATTAAAEGTPLFSPDGQQIALTVSDNPPTWAGTRTVQVVPTAGGVPRKLADTQDDFGRYSELVGWSADGDKLFFTEVQGTSFKLLALPLNGKPVAISRDKGMSLSGVSLNSRRTHFGYGWEQLDQPAEALVSSVAKFEPAVVSAIHRDLPRPPLGKTEVIRWESKDGLEIEGLLTLPVGYEKGKRYPLLLVIHGGPMGAFTQQFDGNPGTYPVAAFASRGYAVLRPNPRGSSGYGKQFRYANYGDWGGGDFRDCVTGVDQTIAQGIADPDRLGVMGWSYGGFMTSWTITQTKRFRAASVGAGVTNLMSFTGTADIPGFLPDYFGGEFWDQPAAYRDHSAMFQVRGVTTPTLIQHGERDERVPLSQGQELYNALKRQGCPTKMIVYPRTPHGIEEPRLLVDCMQRNLEWFGKYIESAHKP
ncbi:MAG: S9 family peptidase [Pirellulaceae bacterium]|nr:S9 family peptidase [Pirellulaceae bacterium]